MLDKVNNLIAEAEALIPAMDAVGDDEAIVWAGQGVLATWSPRAAVAQVRGCVGNADRLAASVEAKAADPSIMDQIAQIEGNLDRSIRVVRGALELLGRIK